MELIEVVARTHFSDSRIGSVSRKQRIRLPKDVAAHLVTLELVEYANPIQAAVKQNPKTEPEALGGDEPPMSSQPDVASLEPTVNVFRRGRRKKTSE